jgi:hypothetical protein
MLNKRSGPTSDDAVIHQSHSHTHAHARTNARGRGAVIDKAGHRARIVVVVLFVAASLHALGTQCARS